MARIPGQPVYDTLVPADDQDRFPITEDTWMLGGLRVVADNAARDAIPLERRKAGMVVITRANGNIPWTLTADMATYTVATGFSGALKTFYTTAAGIAGTVFNELFIVTTETTNKLYQNQAGVAFFIVDLPTLAQIADAQAQAAASAATATAQATIATTQAGIATAGAATATTQAGIATTQAGIATAAATTATTQAGIATTGATTATTQAVIATTQAGIATAASASASASANTAAALIAAQQSPPYATYAAANADLANIPNLGYRIVLIDETKGSLRTIYQKVGGVLTFIGYVDPIQAETNATMQAFVGMRDKALVQTAGQTTALDGGADLWRYDAADVAAASSQIVVPSNNIGRYRRVRKTYDMRKMGWVSGTTAEAQANRTRWANIQSEILASGLSSHIIIPEGRTYLGIVGSGGPRVLAITNGAKNMVIEGVSRETSILTWDTTFDWRTSQPDANIFTLSNCENITFCNFQIDNQIYEVVYPLYTTTLTATALAGATSITVADPTRFIAPRQIVITLDANPTASSNRRTITSIVGNVVNFSGGGLTFDASAGNNVQLYLQEQMHGVAMRTDSALGTSAGRCRGITMQHMILQGIRGDGSYTLGDTATEETIVRHILHDDNIIRFNDRSGTAWQRGTQDVTIRDCYMHDISDSHVDTEITGGTSALVNFRVLNNKFGPCGSYSLAIGSNQSAVQSLNVEIVNNDCANANGFQLTNINGLLVTNNYVVGRPTYSPLTMLRNINNAKFSNNMWIGPDDDINVGYLQDNTAAGIQSSNIEFENDTFDGSAATTPHNISVFRVGQGVQTFKMKNCIAIGSNGTGQSAFQIVSISGQLATGSATYDPPSLANGASAMTTVTATGAAIGNAATASFGISLQGITLSAEVTATNTVTVTFTNNTGGTIDLASSTLSVSVFKQVYDDLLMEGLTGKNVRYVTSLNNNLTTALALNRVTIKDLTPINSGYAVNLACTSGTGINIAFPDLRIEGMRPGTVGNLFNDAGGRQSYYSAGGSSILTGMFEQFSGATPENVVTASVSARCNVLSPTGGQVLWAKRSGTNTNTGWRVVGGLFNSVTYNPPSLANGASTTTTVTVTGAVAFADMAVASFGISLQGITLRAEVTATDTVTVTFTNNTGGTIDLASSTLYARVFQST